MTARDFPAEGVALVVGGSGGIGRAICAKLAESGADVALTYRSNKKAANAVALEVAKTGQKATCYALSAEDAGSVAGTIADIIAAHGRIHTLVNAAGAHIAMKFVGDVSGEEFRDVMNTDVNGFFNVMQAVLPHMREQGGSFVTISTTGLFRWPAKDVLSVAPKAAIDALITGIAREEGRNNIRANTVALGLIDAGLFQKMVGVYYDDRYVEAAVRNTALKRLGTAEEVAEAVTFFASHRARYVTGQTLVLDGGFSL